MCDIQKIVYLDKVTILPELYCSYNNLESIEIEKYLIDSKLLDSIKNVKGFINKVDQKVWTKIRKFINIYESPETSKNWKPISRAFYKLREILVDFNINSSRNVLCLAEAPGGFIQAVIDHRSEKSKDFLGKVYTMSLLSNDPEVPTYHHSIYNHHNIQIIPTNFNGNIKNINCIFQTFYYFYRRKIKMNLITCDGGINDNGSFNDKEAYHINLILCETIISLFLLENNGTFILKIFDLFTKSSLDLLTLLSFLFDKVCIIKPYTSRATNSEKYIVCTSFNEKLFTVSLRNSLLYILLNIQSLDFLCKCGQIHDIDLNCKEIVLSTLFARNTKLIDKIYLYNNNFVLYQIEHINNTINYIQTHNITKSYIDYNSDENKKFNVYKIELNRIWKEKYM